MEHTTPHDSAPVDEAIARAATAHLYAGQTHLEVCQWVEHQGFSPDEAAEIVEEARTRLQQVLEVEAVIETATARLHRGETYPEVHNWVQYQGFSPEVAAEIVKDAEVRLQHARQTEGMQADVGPTHGRDIVIGALWAVGGIVVTLWTLISASSEGGTYLVAWGAILYGVIRIVRGLIREARHERQAPRRRP